MSRFDEVWCLDASLAEKLEAYAVHVQDVQPGIAGAYADLIDRLRELGAGEEALGVGDAMPSFALPDKDGHIRRLDDFLDGGPLVISFNRGHWCSFCGLELLTLNELVPELKQRGASLVSIMPETATHTRQMTKDYSLVFPVLTDIDNGYALSANLMIALGPAVSEFLRANGNDLSAFHGNPSWFVPIPATYVVAGNGRIVASHVDPDFRVRMAPQDILTALDEAG